MGRKLKPQFIQTYFERYFVIDEDGKVDNEATKERFNETFGNDEGFIEALHDFDKIVREKKIDSQNIVKRLSKLIREFEWKKDETARFCFLNDKAHRAIKEEVPRFEYDMKSAWPSQLIDVIPTGATKMILSESDKYKLFELALDGAPLRMLFTIKGKPKDENPFGTRTLKLKYYVWDFELADHFETHDYDDFKIQSIFQVQFSNAAEIGKAVEWMFEQKESSRNIIEQNFWKSQMNNFSWMIFEEHPLVENWVIARTRKKLFDACIGYEDDICDLQLDAVKTTKLMDLDLSDEMGGWRLVSKHTRNFAKAEKLVQFDTKGGIYQWQE